MMPQLRSSEKSMGMAANSMMVTPQMRYPKVMKGFRLPVLSMSPPAKMVVTVAVTAERMTMRVVTVK